MSKFIDIVFDGPPSHESGRFVEVENDEGVSIKWGEWIKRDDHYWALRFTDRVPQLLATLESVEWDEVELKCPSCGDQQYEGHRSACELAAAIALAKGDSK